MKRILTIFIVLLIAISSCTTAKYHLKHGNYDLALYWAVKKIRKVPDKTKAIEVLKKAYPIANEKDHERIKFLKQEGTPEVWDEVFHLYIVKSLSE